MAEKMTRRQITEEEAVFLAERNFQEALRELGISPGEHPVDREGWAAALPYIQRGLKITEAPAKRTRRKANAKQTPKAPKVLRKRLGDIKTVFDEKGEGDE
jgi:hypothetical protein